MKKKILSMVMALCVLGATCVPAFAASPTTQTTSAPAPGQTAATSVDAPDTGSNYASKTSVSDGFTVAAVSDAVVASAVTKVQALLNDLSTLGKLLGNSTLTALAGDSGAKVSAKIATVVDVSPNSATKDADGNYSVTLNVPGISSGDNVIVLHQTSGWDLIKPTAVGNGSVSFKTPSLSPIAVVKLSNAGAKAAPKTGNALPYAVLILAVAAAGMLLSARRVLKK
ncbi:MAG: hypothetical protein K6G07_05395 [Lachnospiraceae bacterium]|nr:hypothetical protein [Lachnospiraceae bacterium]